MTRERDVTREVKSWLASESPVSADRVLALALDEIDTTQQRRAGGWSAWRSPRMFSVVRFTAAAAAIALVTVLAGVYLARPNVGGPSDGRPTPTSQPTMAAMPSGFAYESYVVRDGLATTGVHLEVPTDGSLVVDQSMTWRLEFRATDANQWGIVIADVTNATNHRTRFGEEPITADDPASFLAALRDTGSYDVRDETTVQIDGRPAQLAEITAIPGSGADCSSGGCTTVPHLDVGGEGSVAFNGPNRTYVTAVGDRLLLVEVWAVTSTDLTSYQQIADLIVGSIRFTEAS